jgi:hypothetical protein
MRKIASEIDLSGSSVILIQHGVSDAVEFATTIKNLSHADLLFLPKPFSQNNEALQS